MNGIFHAFKGRRGISTVEIVIIVAVLIGLAFIFKNQIYALLDQIFDRLFKNAGDVTLFTQPPDKTMGNP